MTEWTGGPRPTDGWVVILVRCGNEYRGDARYFRWQWVNEIDDIVAWRAL